MNTGKTLGSSFNQNQNQFQGGPIGTISAHNVLFASIAHLTLLYGPAYTWDESICLPTVKAVGQFMLKTANAIDNVVDLGGERGGQQARAA